MRKELFYFLFISFLFCATYSKAQENHGLLSISSSLQVQNDFNKLQTISRFEAEQNSPNPFNDFTLIDFTSPVQGFIEFKIVNLIGKDVFHRVVEASPGYNTIRFEGGDFTPGVYIYSLSNGTQTITRRMVISKK